MIVIMNRFSTGSKVSNYFTSQHAVFKQPQKFSMATLSEQFPFIDILCRIQFSTGFLDNFSFDITTLEQNVK